MRRATAGILTGILLVLGTGGLRAGTADTISVFPYFTDFEGSTTWTTGVVSGGPNDWVRGTPAKPQIAGARSGVSAFVTKTTGTYTGLQQSYVLSPTFNMSALTGAVLLQFWQNLRTEARFDGGVLELSTDAGLSWRRVDSTLGSGSGFVTARSMGWYNEAIGSGAVPAPFWSGTTTSFAGASGGWVQSTTVITGIAGLPDVRFRWRFGSDALTGFDGWAIDDVSITELPPHDIGVTGLGIPGYTGGPEPGDAIPLRSGGESFSGPAGLQAGPPAFSAAAPVSLDAAVRNFGSAAEPVYQVQWTLDGAPQPPAGNITPLPIAGHDTLQLLIPAPLPGIRTARAWTVLGTDATPANDTSAFTFEVLDTTVVFYEGFNGPVFPPPGWTRLNADGNAGAITNWYAGSFAPPQEGAGQAGNDYRTANGFFINDYLITPNTGSLLEAYTVDSLSFWLIANNAFPDSVQVLVSTSTPDPDSFTVVLDYIRPPAVWTKYTYALPDAPSRYVAFRYLLYNGGPSGANSDAVGLDNVRITRSAFFALLAAQDSLDLDSVLVGQARTDTITVTNTGNIPLDVTAVSVVPPFGTASVLPVTIPPAGSAELTVTFAPPGVGPFSAPFIITHTGDNTPDTVHVSGTGIQPAFAVSPGALGFDSVATGSGATDTVVVQNPGSSPLTVSTAATTNPQFVVSPAGPVVVPAGGTAPFLVTFSPLTFGIKNGLLVFTHDAPGSPDTVSLTGIGFNLIPTLFLSLPPETLAAKDPIKQKFLKASKRGKGLAPTWANLIEETVAQGGFQPGASESDSTGGMRIGLPSMVKTNPLDPLKPKWKVVKDSAKVKCWVRLSSWDFKKSVGKSASRIVKTLENKVFKHASSGASPRGFDSTGVPGGLKRKKLLKQLTKLDPKKTPNPLYGELVAFKFSIAASQLGKTPVGFGELIYDVDGSPFDELTLREIAREADTAMTRARPLATDQAYYDSLYATLHRVNRAFAGPLDTVSFEVSGTLVLRGAVDIATIGFLREGTTPPLVLPRTSTATETEEDFEEEGWEFDGEMPLASDLLQNFPNPFNPVTTLGFRLVEPAVVSLTVYDLLGREVARVLATEELEAGLHTMEFDGTTLASGVYMARMDAAAESGIRTVRTMKMLLLK